MNTFRYFCTLLSLVICLGVQTTFGSSCTRTLLDFGVQAIRGEIQYPLPKNVFLGFLTRENGPDAASVEHDTLKIYKNPGNGEYRLLWQRKLNGRIRYVRFMEERLDRQAHSDLFLKYADGSEEIVRYEDMQRALVRLDYMPPLPSYPTLNFQEQWRSGAPGFSRGPFIGDIDNDGRTEVVCMFYSATQDSIDTLVVYEHLGGSNYRVDWDTLIFHAGPLFGLTDVNVDGKKEILFYSREHDHQNTTTVKLLECHGERKYRLYNTNIGVSGSLWKIIEDDIDHTGAHELIALIHLYDSGTTENVISICKFVGSGIGSGGWIMAFDQYWERSWSVSTNINVGQLDGAGYDEIILNTGGAYPGEREPLRYLAYDPQASGGPWVRRTMETGLASGFNVGFFMNIDSDPDIEIVMASGGPDQWSSVAALKQLHDTVYSVLWVDSTWRTGQTMADTATFNGVPVIVFGTNNGLDTVKLKMYSYTGNIVATWSQDSTALFSFRLLDIDGDGRLNMICNYFVSFTGSYIADLEESTPTAVSLGARNNSFFALEQNYPNPFNPRTTISYYLPHAGFVSLKVFNILGQQIATLVSKSEVAGSHIVQWNAGSFSSGIYFYQLESNHQRLIRKMALAK